MKHLIESPSGQSVAHTPQYPQATNNHNWERALNDKSLAHCLPSAAHHMFWLTVSHLELQALAHSKDLHKEFIWCRDHIGQVYLIGNILEREGRPVQMHAPEVIDSREEALGRELFGWLTKPTQRFLLKQGLIL